MTSVFKLRMYSSGFVYTGRYLVYIVCVVLRGGIGHIRRWTGQTNARL